MPEGSGAEIGMVSVYSRQPWNESIQQNFSPIKFRVANSLFRFGSADWNEKVRSLQTMNRSASRRKYFRRTYSLYFTVPTGIPYSADSSETE